MAGHPCACAAVGSGNVEENQARTGSENAARAVPGASEIGAGASAEAMGRAYAATLTVTPGGSVQTADEPAQLVAPASEVPVPAATTRSSPFINGWMSHTYL